MSTAILIEITTELLWIIMAFAAVAAIIFALWRWSDRVSSGPGWRLTRHGIHYDVPPPSDKPKPGAARANTIDVTIEADTTQFEAALENIQRQLTGIREPIREFGVAFNVDAATIDRRLFVVGRNVGGSWEFDGVYSTAAQAERRCTTPDHWVGPAILDENITEETTPWPGAYYPTNDLEPEPEPEPATEGLLSPSERRALDHIAAFTRELRQFCAGSDLFEAVDKIHQLQAVVMAQAAARAYPNDFRLLTPPSGPEDTACDPEPADVESVDTSPSPNPRGDVIGGVLIPESGLVPPRRYLVTDVVRFMDIPSGEWRDAFAVTDITDGPGEHLGGDE